MAPVSVPTARSRAAVDSARSLDVIDVIEIKASYGLGVPPGVVLVLRDFRPLEPDSLVGQLAMVRNPMGDHWLAEVEGTRDHGTTVSIHLAGLTRENLPIGSVVTFPRLSGPLEEKLFGPSDDTREPSCGDESIVLDEGIYPSETYPIVRKIMRAAWNNPAMDEYDEYREGP
jgi:hypothetical protein